MAEQMKRTPLYEEHVKLGAKLVPFAGFEMPVQYPEGVASEHRTVREGAGLFDVSHMGEFLVSGTGAEAFVNYVVSNDVSRIVPGQAQYSVMCNEDGGIVDDLLIYKFPDRIRLVVNAANIEKDFAWIQRRLGQHEELDVELVNESDEVALLALQGPASEPILGTLTDADLASVGYYRFVEGRVAGEPCVISRTGYTGEDGFELYCEPGIAAQLWTALIETGGEYVGPVGLGARDTLRLEMGYALYGSDIDEETTPLEAGLAWTVKLDGGDFVGRRALLSQKEAGVERRFRGFTLEERGFPRPGYEILAAGEVVGKVRSGTVGPSVAKGIGTGYLPLDICEYGTEIELMIRGRALPAVVTQMPFSKGGSIQR
jgi:aminomethyltransferase